MTQTKFEDLQKDALAIQEQTLGENLVALGKFDIRETTPDELIYCLRAANAAYFSHIQQELEKVTPFHDA